MPSASSLEPTIYGGLDGVSASVPTNTTGCDKSTAPGPTKRPRSTDIDSGVGVVSDDQESLRPAKRRRDSDGTFHFSPTLSSRRESTASVTSHHTKMGGLAQSIGSMRQRISNDAVIFCDFDSVEAETKQSDVAAMHTAAQMLAEGLGVLEYENTDAFNASIAELPHLDRTRLQRPWVKDSRPAHYGSTPAIHKIANIR